MSSSKFSDQIINQYLDILNVDFNTPDMKNLENIVSAYLCCIPFENISKLYYLNTRKLKNIPEIELYLDGIKNYGFGGTCYSNNYYLYLLLANLGFDVKLCGADINNPDSHLVSVVTFNGTRYLVDVGYAAPFLKPMNLDLTEPYFITLGRDRYQINPQKKDGKIHLDMFRDGKLRHGYILKPYARQFEEFANVIDNSFKKDSTFMKSLLLVQFSQDTSIAVSNLSIIKSNKNTSEISELDNKEEMIKSIEEIFSIPSEITAKAIKGINLSGDAWS